MPKQPRTRTVNATPTALAFTNVLNPEHVVTRVGWSDQVRPLLEAMDASLRPYKEGLPVRDLRLRLQARDAGVIRVDRSFGRGVDPTLALSATGVETAERAANAAVADWVQEAVLELERVDARAAKALRQLALNGGAVGARTHRTQVFQWEAQRQTGSAKPTTRTQYADLADFVADKLAGREVYPEAGPMRRVVSSDLGTNHADLMSDPITLDVADTQVRFSVGITVSVETYPGRSLPVIQLRHKKFVWAREPRAGFDDLSGYVLPAGEARALRFEVGADLSLTAEYQALARRYDLPLTGVTAADLALRGTTGVYGQHRVVITHRNGRAETDAALRGVTDLDRRLSFERAAEHLKLHGFTPWTAIREIPTFYGQQSDADMAWKLAFEDPPAIDENTDRKTLKAIADAEREFQKWTERVRGAIDEHYGGSHHLVIGYYNGLLADAERAKAILESVLGEGATIHLEALPDNVHGPRTEPKGTRPAERARARALAWAPFVTRLRQLQDAAGQPLHGVLVLADEWYGGRHDDSVNKRAARITLNRELGLTVQYLLPSKRKKDGTPTHGAEKNFQVRTINAWRDLAWKSIGKMHGIQGKLVQSLGVADEGFQPTVLGLGIIRTNRTGFRQNETSFIPYAVELDTVTGTCRAAVMLREGDGEPRITNMMELPQVIRVLTANGPSYLARRKTKKETEEERKRLTQEFVHRIAAERATAHRDLIVLADASTLSGMWPWLADASLHPESVRLGAEPHAEQDFPDASLVRLRPGHAPKVIMDTPRVRVTIDGKVRPSATWSNADLYHLTDTGPAMPTYLSFGSRIFKPRRGASTYRPIPDEKGNPGPPHTDAWITPNALEITVVRSKRHAAEDLAKLVEALRSEYAHFGSWTSAPGPLHFASFLKDYVPDYDLAEEEEQESGEEVA
ncbi:RNaseH domain-containing protein [Deinococcus planocerae]|uniref:RNaseH domain-containing protein n=1 Tax=Deinococcus planocerae TaxID=1737569 RepID=UPI000C7F44AC|nr:RNaseH domain-containing protein [Deinococcus planocerae]